MVFLIMSVLGLVIGIVSIIKKVRAGVWLTLYWAIVCGINIEAIIRLSASPFQEYMTTVGTFMAVISWLVMLVWLLLINKNDERGKQNGQ